MQDNPLLADAIKGWVDGWASARNFDKAGTAVGKATKDAVNFIGRNIRSLFGVSKNSGPPPNRSSYVNLGNSATNNNLATAAALFGGSSGVMNELSIVKFHNAAPAGSFAVNYNGSLRYWSESFNGGTRANITSSFVQASKESSNYLKFASKLGSANLVGSYIGYYGAVDNLINGDYYGAVREGVANRYGVYLANSKGNLVGIGWTIGWNILGPMTTNSEFYNRIFFGKNSAIYQDLERKNGWYESKIFKD